MKTVMCFGTFDLLHLGHLSYFEQAKHYGDRLIVVIARDHTKEQQQKKILFNENERLKLIQSLRLVDEAVLGNNDDHFRIIKEKKPDIICLGYDHPLKEEKLAQKLLSYHLQPKIIRLKPYAEKLNKSTLLREKVLSL